MIMKRNLRNYLALLAVLLVAVISYKCSEAFEPLLSDQKVTLSAPLDGLTTTDSAQTFYWQLLKDATKYQLQVVSTKFDSIVRLVADTTITTNMFTIILKKGRYQWRVKALNNSTSTDFSSIRSLTIQ